MNDLGRGCNIWTGEGGYTAEATTVIYTIIDKDQMPQLKQTRVNYFMVNKFS